MRDIDVSCAATATGWTCEVSVRDRGTATRHHVTVDRAVLARLAPAASDPVDLVRRSFEFLLAREAKESILRSFDLPVIGTYFPEYERTIRAGTGTA